MKKLGEIFLQFIFAVIGIILIGALPTVFLIEKGQWINFTIFFETIGTILHALVNIKEMTFMIRGEVYQVYPDILEAVVYSFVLLFAALVIAYLVSVLLTLMTMLLPQKFRERIKFAIFLLESLPDILVIILLQLLIIMIYKKTDILLMKVVSVGDERAYLLPIICLAVLPTIQLYRLCLYLFEEEFTKDYVLLTRAKGLKHSFILVVHILRNTVISMFFNSKKTLWYMLSALVVVEFLYGIIGITHFLTHYMVPEVFTFTLLAFFVPIFFVYHVIKIVLEHAVNRGESLS